MGEQPLTQGLEPQRAVHQAGMRGRACQEGYRRSKGWEPRGGEFLGKL